MLLLLLATFLLSAGQQALAQSHHFYMANNSLVGTPVDCSEAQKECFRYHRILHEPSGKCYRPAEGPEDCPLLVLDWRKWNVDGGKISSICLPEDQCPDFETRMAYDGSCKNYKLLEDICVRSRGLSVSNSMYGTAECWCSDCQERPLVPQPETPGRCIIPDLRREITYGPTMLLGNCSRNQAKCFSNNKVYFDRTKRCYKLLEQGPCGSGGRLVLKENDAKNNRIRSVCAKINNCRGNRRRLLLDRKCHSEEEFQKVICPEGDLFEDAFGLTFCERKPMKKGGTFGVSVEIQLMSDNEKQCKVQYIRQAWGSLR